MINRFIAFRKNENNLITKKILISFLSIIFIVIVLLPLFELNDAFDSVKKLLVVAFGGVLIIHNAILNNKIRLQKYDIVFLGLITYISFTGFWAYNSSYAWLEVFNFCYLFIAYFSFKICFIYLEVVEIARMLTWLNLTCLASVAYFLICQLLYSGGIDYLTQYEIQSYYGKNGNYISSIIVILFPSFIMSFKYKTAPKLILFIGMIIGVIFVLYIFSLASLLVLLLICLIIGFSYALKNKFRTIAVLISIFALTLLVGILFFDFGFDFLLEAYNPFNSRGERTLIWFKSLELIKTSVLFGHGANNWYLLFPMTDLSDFKISANTTKYYRYAHNIFIQYLSEWGLIGLCLFLWLLFLPLYKLIQKRKHDFLPFLLMLVSYCILNQFYSILHTSLLHFSGAGLIWVFVSAYIMSNHDYISKNNYNLEINKWFSLLVFMPLVFYILYAYEHYSYRDYKKNRKLQNEKRLPFYEVKSTGIYWGIFDIKYVESQYLRRKKKMPESLLMLKMALKAEPFNPKYLNQLAQYYLEMEDFDKSKEETLKLLKLNHTILDAHIRMLKIAIAQNDTNLFDEYINHPKTEIDRLVRFDENNPLKQKLKNYEKNIKHIFKHKSEIDKLVIKREKLKF